MRSLFLLIFTSFLWIHTSYAQNVNDTYKRIPSWYLDGEVVYKFLQILPSETENFMVQLYDNEVVDYYKILMNASKILRIETYCAEKDSFDDSKLDTKLYARLEKCGKEINEGVYNKMQQTMANIEAEIMRVLNGAVQGFLSEVLYKLKKLNNRTWHRLYMLETLINLAKKGTAEVLESDLAKTELGNKFPYVLHFLENYQTQALVQKSVCCKIPEILQEMVDEAKYRMKNGIGMNLNVTETRWRQKTTVRCDLGKDCHIYQPIHC
ncbi:hypothetical protein L596_012012 [Steinernema carpocapsae]|uniref:Vitellogenin domain-containing protein n=1 Tax=Steinernema carpocapsae TaxID=34508 RepID=A0A4U5NWN2_STECR|nr:hypothetical protein L596_012012 [Steinernema carpocapsae]